MKQNVNIEAEGSELILKNKAGDYVIIPKKYRVEVEDMIKNNCHSCIDNLVNTLPTMKDYAKKGTVVPKNNLKFIPIEELVKENYKYNTLPVDNVNTKQRSDINKDKEIKKPVYIGNPTSKYFKPTPVKNTTTIKDAKKTNYDNYSDYIKEQIDEYVDRVENPTFFDQFREAVELIPRYAANPLKFLGDVTSILPQSSPLNGIFPNTNQERYDRRKYLYDPLLDSDDKRDKSAQEAMSMIPDITRNIALAEFGYVFNGYLPTAFKEAAQIGSLSSLAGDTFEVYDALANNNIDRFVNDDDFRRNFLLNFVGIFSRFDNFDASTIKYNLQNWSQISQEDKFDTAKDVFNLINAARNQKRQ